MHPCDSSEANRICSPLAVRRAGSIMNWYEHDGEGLFQLVEVLHQRRLMGSESYF
jgi:hypothetical protein